MVIDKKITGLYPVIQLSYCINNGVILEIY